MIRASHMITVIAGTICMLTMDTTAKAANIMVFSVPPLRSAMSAIIPQFEQSSGHAVNVAYGTPPQLADRLERGEVADVLLITREVSEKLQRQGKIRGPVDIAKVGMGVAIRRGALRPDIGSREGFKRTLLSARSIAYIDPATGAPGGIYLANLFERLGIATELEPKTKRFGPSGAETAVAAGEVELALSQITVITASPGVELAGPLPPEIQNYLEFTASATVSGNDSAGAQSFVTFISSPAAKVVMKAKGFE